MLHVVGGALALELLLKERDLLLQRQHLLARVLLVAQRLLDAVLVGAAHVRNIAPRFLSARHAREERPPEPPTHATCCHVSICCARVSSASSSFEALRASAP